MNAKTNFFKSKPLGSYTKPRTTSKPASNSLPAETLSASQSSTLSDPFQAKIYLTRVRLAKKPGTIDP